MRKILLLFLFIISATLFPFHAHAATLDKPVITIVNPIRGQELGHIGDNLLAGLQNQWDVTKQFGMPATWLWQYSALDNPQLVSFAKSQMKGQEFGLFFEIDRNFASHADVQYKGQGPWYFSDGLFLFSYDTAERHKFIDTLFAKFYKTFGYFPTTVGSWWMDADSLAYMQQKYGITAAFHAADQYNLDVYTIWGTPWSIPYLPSSVNAGIPANNATDSLHLVMMQWAPRDPLQGYGNSDQNSTYSLQDYELKGYDISYFRYLSSVFLKKPLDQIIVGIENGNAKSNFGPGSHYYAVLQEASTLQKENKITIALVKDYAHAFLQKGNVYAPTNYFLTNDYKTDNQSFWYNGTSYRVGIQKIGDVISLVDLRSYQQKVPEDFAVLPNSQGFLRIDTPALIDSATMPTEKRLLITSKDPLRIEKQGNSVVLFTGAHRIASFTDSHFDFVDKNINDLFAHQQSTLSYYIFFMLFGLFLIYCLLLYFSKKSLPIALTSLSLLPPLLLSFPFLTNGSFQFSTMLFDKKEIIFLLPFLVIPFTQFTSMIFMQVIPLLLLPIFHYLFVVRFPGRIRKVFFTLYFIFIFAVYFHLPYFPLDRSTYIFVGVAFVNLFILLCAVCVFAYKLFQSRKLLFITSAASGLFFILLLISLLTSRTMLAVAPFEMHALSFIASEHKEVLYVMPQDTPIYKAVKPLLFASYRFGSLLTHEKWIGVMKDGKGNISLPQEKLLLFVPRYLGSDISSATIAKDHLQKVFDNMQIAIYEN